MLFKQITHDDLGCASYLIGDEQAGVAAVVDPRFEIDEYLELARYRGVSIAHVLETHNHADHVSGHGRLVAATGARIHVHRAAQAAYDHEPFDDGWELQLGSLTVRALHTPGHRPEHTAFLLIDAARGAEPWAVFSGDSLFVGDVARTDLAIEKSRGAREIFASVHGKLLTLPDDCELWPAHLGGSMCGGAGMDAKICSTIGFERRHNPTLAIVDEDRVRSAGDGQARTPAAQLREDRGAQPRTARDQRRGGAGAVSPPGAAQARRGGAAGGRADRPAVRRRAHPRLDLHSVVHIRLRLQARVARRARPGGRVHRPRRRRRATRGEARPLGGRAQHRWTAGGRNDELAPGTPPGRPHRPGRSGRPARLAGHGTRAAAAGRARAPRVGRRSRARLGVHRVARHHGHPAGDRRHPTDRRGLRRRRARGDRRQPAEAPRSRRRDPRGRRRRASARRHRHSDGVEPRASPGVLA